MKKLVLASVLIFAACIPEIYPQSPSDTSVYLVTCGQGKEIYSIYGHSALRVVIPEKNFDMAYNWGVFDFETPNFAYKFAKGRLEYMLYPEPFGRFLMTYNYEMRWVQIQKINLSPSETRVLIGMINENLKPENLKYRYDFLYDNCSTRIRDLLEKSIGKNLIYSPPESKKKSSFRFLVGTYQDDYPWLDFGIDMLLGTPCDKRATDRDKMFLPLELQSAFTQAYLTRGNKTIPMLRNAETILDYGTPVVKNIFIFEPFFVFTLVCIAVIIFSAVKRSGKAVRITDVVIFSIYSIMAVMLLFTNFLSLHSQLKANLSMIWLSPFVILCLVALVLRKKWMTWFRIVFYLCIAAFLIQIIVPSFGNNAFMPLIMILLVRSSVYAGFSWNPLTINPI